MTSEDSSKRPLADDPQFLDSLSDLDRGIVDSGPPKARSAELLSPSKAAPVQAGEGRPRRLLDLFPSALELKSAISAPASGPMASVDARPRAQGLGFGRRAAAKVGPAPRRSTEPTSPAEYETFYGLDERPFSVTTDPRFLYHSTAHDRAAQAMLDAIRRRDGIAVLTGELGVGKTMLCRTVMDQLDRRTLTSLVTKPFATPEDLVKTVLVDFGVISHADRSMGRLAEASLADLSAALRDFLYSLAPLQAFAVVIIDDAHTLSVEMLRHIAALADTGGDEQLLQLMLVGQPSLSSTLVKSALRPLFQRVTARAVLAPLVADEVSWYIAHRLRVAGPNARVEFDPASAAELHALSGGVPRIVNVLGDRALTLGYQESAATIDKRLVRRAAEDLDLAPPSAKTSSAWRVAAMAAAFALLLLLGAAVGALVFRSDVAALFEQWQAMPAPPPAPPPTLAPPYSPGT